MKYVYASLKNIQNLKIKKTSESLRFQTEKSDESKMVSEAL